MRLRILDSGHGFGTKALFALIRTVSRQPVLDVIKLVKYRADFYGNPMQAITQDAMRGPSTWSVGDRELMAAFVAKTNQCEFCIKAHTAVAKGAYRDGEKVSAVLSDLDTADRRCARGLLLVQCNGPVGRCLRLLCPGPPGL
jgi:AhpD family alkylhydroperoxidase